MSAETRPINEAGVESCYKCGGDIVRYKAHYCKACQGYYCATEGCIDSHRVDGTCGTRAEALHADSS